MAQLLVSIRDTAEAEMINDCDVAIVDVKEPTRGSLGAATPKMLESISQVITQPQTLSFAAGELSDWLSPNGQSLNQSPGKYYESVWNRFDFIKLGLAGVGKENHHWQTPLQLFFDEIPKSGKTKPVVVSYLDFQSSQTPSPRELIDFASSLDDCSTILFDTFRKSENSIAFHSQLELTDLIAKAKSQGLTTVLAGSITAKCLPTALRSQPDFIGVRGAVCDSQRTGSINTNRVNEFARALQQPN